MHTRVGHLFPAGVVAAAALLLGLADPAAAGMSGDGWVDNRSGDVGAVAGVSSDGTGAGGGDRGDRGGGGSGSACQYVKLSDSEQQTARSMAQMGWADSPTGPGAYYRVICPGSATVVFVPQGAPPIDPAVVARQALDRANIPLPGMRLNPPAGTDQIVNLPTWLWVDNWAPVSASASAGPVTATVTARPLKVVWSMGDGGSTTCVNGGTRYDPTRPPEDQRPSCSYTYRRGSARSTSGTFMLRATSVWQVKWAATGITAAGDFGLVTRSTEVAVRVAEIQTVQG